MPPVSEISIENGPIRLNVATSCRHSASALLLHGVVRCWQDFVPFFPVLGTRFGVYAVDFRGHGKSGRAQGRYAVNDYVQDALHTIQTLVEGRLVVYGHSLGALAAIACAATLPERIDAIVLEDPPVTSFGPAIAGSEYHDRFIAYHQILADRPAGIPGILERLKQGDGPTGAIAAVKGKDPAGVRFTAHCLAHLDPTVLEPLIAGTWMAGYNVDELLAEIQCPVLLLYGNSARGGLLSQGDAHHIASRAADCTAVSFEQDGHHLRETNPVKVSHVVSRFLATI